MRVYLDIYCSGGFHDDTWTGNWTDDSEWNLGHSDFDVQVRSDVQAGLFSASIRLDCDITCKKCGNSWGYWIKYGAFSDGGKDYKYYNCCGNELKLVFEKCSF